MADIPDNSLLYAVDNHNVANGDPSWFDKKVTATGELVTDAAQWVGYGIPAATVAGVVSLANTASAVGNFLGMDTEQTKTYDVLKGFDEDLAGYYSAHEQGAELGGFVIGSILPGMAGVKALQMVKAGVMGNNTLGSMGLMKSLTADYAAAAKAEFALTQSPFTILNGNVIKSLAQGFGAQVLEAEAFNIAATASLYKSPTLENQSITDLFWNDLKMAFVWGGVAGTVVGAKNVFGINKAITDVKKELLPQQFITEIPNNERVEPILKVLTYFKNKFDLPEAMGPLKADASLGISGEELLALKTTAREKTVGTLDNLIRGSLNEFAGGDTAIGNALFEATTKATKFEDILQSLGPHAQKASRIGTEDAIAASDVFFLSHGAKYERFQDILKAGAFDELLAGKGKEFSQGYQVVGDLSKIKVTGAKQGGSISAGAKEDAFASGYDIFRNPNGNYSVNPNSQILKKVLDRPVENKILIDLEDNATVKFRGTPGLADLSSKTKPIQVRGDVVLAGDLSPIRIGSSTKFNPLEELPHIAQARTIWAQTAKIEDGMRIGEFDLPLLERIYQEGDALGNKAIYIIGEKGPFTAPRDVQLKNYIIQQKQKLIEKAGGLPVDELSVRLNIKDSFITEGTELGWMKINKTSDIQQPRYAKVLYDPKVAESMPMMNTMNHTGALEYARQVEAVKTRTQQNFAAFSKEMNELFPEGISPADPRWNSASAGAGSGLIGFANANYGTYGSWAQYVGSLTNKLLLEKKTASAKTLNNAFAQLAIDEAKISGKQKVAEAALINNRLLRSPDGWKFHPDGDNVLVLAKEWDDIAKGVIDEPTEQIVIQSKEVGEFFRTHMELNAARQTHIGNMKGAAGVGDSFNPSILYPVPVNTEKLKHFVRIKPRAPVSLDDKARVIAAKDEATLKTLVSQIDQNKFVVETREDIIARHKGLGDYEAALGFNDSAVDSALKREGLLSQHFPTIDEGFLDRMMEWHMRQEELLTRSMVYHRYSQEFEELKHLGKQELGTATSQFGFISKGLERSVKDPYNDIIKTALDISRSSEYRPWINFNQFVRDSIEVPINKLRDIWRTNPQIDMKFVEDVNKITDEMGMGRPFTTAMSVLTANKNVPDRNWLSMGIAKVQSVLSTTLLQWDSFNALNNILGNAVLSSPELNSIIKAINSGNSEVAGKLAQLTTVKVPGKDFTIPTKQKLLENAIHNYSRDPKITQELIDRYRSIGTITDLSQLAKDSFNKLVIDWRTVTDKQVQSSVESAAEFGRKWTGNRKAEEFNRFIASDIARQLTDLAEQAGVMKRAESNEYIQMFVNRTQGNHLYSQRPIVFQGVVGQAISLFQTYQFNLIQQLLRHVASGDTKTAAMMMAMQGSIYGMNGLPAFNFVNTHLVGNASGNTLHTDLYQGAYATLGKEVGDWVLYGAGSNALGIVDPSMKFNLYSRGDINPRHLTVLPTELVDVPAISASIRFVDNIYTAAKRVSAGGDLWNSFAQAIEHNGLSRPLSGLAMIAQGHTTTREGGLLSASQDFWDISTLTRLAGGKPFNEAVALDNLYRINAYKAKDSLARANLGAAIKTSLIAGQNPSPEDINQFAMDYVKRGGKIDNFQKFFANASLTANRSQVNAIAQNLSSPVNRQLQVVMGGTPLPDYLNTSGDQ